LIDVVDMPPAVLERFTGHRRADGRLSPHIAKMAIVPDDKVRGKRRHVIDGRRYRVLGVGGLVWEQGLCWLWLGDVDEKRTPAVLVVRMAKNMLCRAVQLGEHRIVAARDDFPKSEKLLQLLGFKRVPDDPALNGRELWIWLTSPQSPQ